MISSKAKLVMKDLQGDTVAMGHIKAMAKDIKKDHPLALELWASKAYYPRLLSVLIFDKKELTLGLIEELVVDMDIHTASQRNQLADWLMANQLAKSKKTIDLLESFENHPLSILRRLFWYYQARLRWTGKTPPDNTEQLLKSLEIKMAHEAPEVQWAMNMCAGWIGVYELDYRKQCIQLGERIGLYKGVPVSKGCTPSYLPEFIQIECEKRR